MPDIEASALSMKTEVYAKTRRVNKRQYLTRIQVRVGVGEETPKAVHTYEFTTTNRQDGLKLSDFIGLGIVTRIEQKAQESKGDGV